MTTLPALINHVPVIWPDVIVREGWDGAPVYDVQAIVWRDGQKRVVGYEASFAKRLISQARREGVVIGLAIGFALCLFMSFVAGGWR